MIKESNVDTAINPHNALAHLADKGGMMTEDEKEFEEFWLDTKHPTWLEGDKLFDAIKHLCNLHWLAARQR